MDLALKTIFERAYFYDPVRTHNDLLDLGYRTLAAELRIDEQQGRLAEVAAALDWPPRSARAEPA